MEAHPNSQVMMNVAKNLRVERDREKKVAAQKQEQLTNVCTHLFQYNSTIKVFLYQFVSVLILPDHLICTDLFQCKIV